MPLDILLINSIFLTLFIIVLDQMFIEGHLTPFDSFNDCIDEDEVKKIKKKLKKEKEKERKKKMKSDDELIDELTANDDVEKHINRILDEDDNSIKNTQQPIKKVEKFEESFGNLDNIDYNSSNSANSANSFNSSNSANFNSFDVLGYNE